jgi:hypothetical protein
MSTTNSDPKVEKKSKFILAIAVVSIAIVVFLAYLVYNFLILPNLVQMSVSKNLDIYKNYSSESQKLLDKIESESKYVEVNEVQNSLKKIENIKPEVEKLSILKNDLNSGPTKNTQNFSKNLSSKMIADQSLKTYLNFKICLFEKYNKEASYVQEIASLSTKLRENDKQPTDGEMSAYFGATTQLFSDVKINIQSLKDCYSGDYAAYESDETKSAIEVYENSMQSAIDIMQQVNKFYKENNQEKFNEKVAELNNIDGNKSFFSINNETKTTGKALEIVKKDIQNQTTSLEELEKLAKEVK